MRCGSVNFAWLLATPFNSGALSGDCDVNVHVLFLADTDGV